MRADRQSGNCRRTLGFRPDQPLKGFFHSVVRGRPLYACICFGASTRIFSRNQISSIESSAKAGVLVINRYRFLHSYKPAYGRLLLLASVFSVTACGSVPSTHVVFPTHGESVTAEAPIAPSLAASTQASPPVSTTTLSNGDVKHEAATTPSAEVLQHRHEPRPISPKAKNPLPEIAPHVTITKSGSAVYYIPKETLNKVQTL